MCVSSNNLFFQKISYYPFIDISMFYLKYLTINTQLSHFQAMKAQLSLCQCTASPELSLLALNERKNREIWYLSYFKTTKSQSSFCQCTDSPELSLLASMRKKILKIGIRRILKHRRLS